MAKTKRRRRRGNPKPSFEKTAKKYAPVLGIVVFGSLLAISLAPAWNASGAGGKLAAGATNLVSKMKPGAATGGGGTTGAE